MLDVKQANALLDKIGLAKKDARRLPAAHRQRRAAAPPGDRDRGVPAVSEAVRDGRGAMAQDRHPGRRARRWSAASASPSRPTTSTRLFVWNNGGTELLYLFPHLAIPVDPTAAFGPEYATWYASGGKQGTKPDDPNILKIFELLPRPPACKADGRNKNAQEIWKILVDQQYGIGTVGQSPAGLGVRLVIEPAGQHRRARLQRAALPHAGQLPSGDVVLQGMMVRAKLPPPGGVGGGASFSGSAGRC